MTQVYSERLGTLLGHLIGHNLCFADVTENVESWPHLGHIITGNGYDKLDIMRRRSDLIGQVNNVIC